MEKPYFNIPALEAIQKQRMDLARRKNADYAGVCDAIGITGIQGLATRLFDKAARLLSLTQPGVSAQVKDESIRDTLLDMANYSEYGVSLLDGTWGNRRVTLDNVPKFAVGNIVEVTQLGIPPFLMKIRSCRGVDGHFEYAGAVKYDGLTEKLRDQFKVLECDMRLVFETGDL